MTGTQCRLQAAAPCWANIRSCHRTCLLTSWGVAQAASQVRGPPLWCLARCGSQGLPSLAAGWTHPSPLLPWHSPPLRTKGSVVVQVPHGGDQETPPLAHTAHPGVRPNDGEQILKPRFKALGELLYGPAQAQHLPVQRRVPQRTAIIVIIVQWGGSAGSVAQIQPAYPTLGLAPCSASDMDESDAHHPLESPDSASWWRQPWSQMGQLGRSGHCGGVGKGSTAQPQSCL